MNQLKESTVAAEVPLWREADALVRRADAQAIFDVGEVALALEEPEEVLALRPLHAADRRVVFEELLRLRVPEQELVEPFDDLVGALLREALERREAREILVGDLEERATTAELGVIDVEDLHVLAMAHGVSADAETIGAELGERIRRACGAEFARAHVRALASGGGLFGALVLLFRSAASVDSERLELAIGFVDLAATALNKAAQVDALRHAYDELRTSQDALLRTEKLRALGQMAAGVTHDLKNLLYPISLYLQVLERAALRGDADGVKKGIEEARRVVRRGVETVERLTDFSRQAPEAKLESADVNHLVHEAGDLAKPRMASRKGRINTIREELGSPPSICARTGEIVSAIVNLVVNAIDAMPEGGTITLRTRADGGGAIVEVADDGPGMPPDVEKRVFEPFFTTKGDAGTGLGLAMVYACVQRHGGSIALVTAPGEGTTFTLWFPSEPHVAATRITKP